MASLAQRQTQSGERDAGRLRARSHSLKTAAISASGVTSKRQPGRRRSKDIGLTGEVRRRGGKAINDRSASVEKRARAEISRPPTCPRRAGLLVILCFL